METKAEIRKRVLALRDSLPPDRRLRSNMLLADEITGHEWFAQAKVLLLFAGYGGEVDTRYIAQNAYRAGKRVCYPKVLSDGAGAVMEFYEVRRGEALAEGYRGIPEPDVGRDKKYEYDPARGECALMLMPGVAFDPARNRVGYGKGFYDKYLADKPELRTIAIGFDIQMVDAIPAGEHDIRPMQVICL